MKLTDALDLVTGLANCKLGNDKLDFLRKHKNIAEFTMLLYWLLSSDVVLGIKQLSPTGIKGSGDVEFSDLVKLIDKLRVSNINDTLRVEVLRFISKMPYEYQDILSALICKTLKVGVTAVNVNKAYGYEVVPEFKCMLADVTTDTEYPAYAEKKHDGIRALAVVYNNKCTLFTRQGNVIPMPNIQSDYVSIAKGQNLVFDMELVASTRMSVAGKINSIIKKGYCPIKAEGIIAQVFDVIPYDNFIKRQEVKTPLVDRKLELSNLLLTYKGSLINYGEADIVNNDDELKVIVNNLIDSGEEGAVVKPLSSTYEFKRSAQWGKHKAINSCTLKVIDATKGTNARKGKIGAFTCASECGAVVVDVGSGLTKDDLDTITKESIVGKYVEVLFNALIRGEDNEVYSLFLPRLKKNDWLRIDKTEADGLGKILQEHIGKPMI